MGNTNPWEKWFQYGNAVAWDGLAHLGLVGILSPLPFLGWYRDCHFQSPDLSLEFVVSFLINQLCPIQLPEIQRTHGLQKTSTAQLAQLCVQQNIFFETDFYAFILKAHLTHDGSVAWYFTFLECFQFLETPWSSSPVVLWGTRCLPGGAVADAPRPSSAHMLLQPNWHLPVMKPSEIPLWNKKLCKYNLLHCKYFLSPLSHATQFFLHISDYRGPV